MPGGVEIWQAALGAVVTIIGGYLVYKASKGTAAASKAASEDTARVNEQESALEAWKELLQPYRDEVAGLRAELNQERKDRTTENDTLLKQHARMHQRIEAQDERINFLTIQLQHWKRLAKVMARWATTLRDQVVSLGGEVPASPEELLLIQSLDDDDL